MTFSPEGPQASGPGSGGYGSYGGTPQDSARQSSPGYGSYGPGQYGSQAQSQPPQAQPPQSQQPPFGTGQQSSAPTASGQYNPPLASDRPSPLPRILALAVAALGVVNFLVGLAGQYEVPSEAVNFFFVQAGDPTSIALLLAGGLVAATGLLPKQANTVAVAAALSLAGWLVLVFQAFNTGDTGPIGSSIELGTGAIIVLALGFIQSALAVAATLFGAGILKAPQPKPVSYGQQNFQGYGAPQAGGYGAQNQNYGGYGQNTSGYGAQNTAGQGQAQGQSQGYVPPAYTGQPSQNQPNQNTTGSLGYPVGTAKPESQSGLTGPAPQNSPYSQGQYGQPVGSGGYGAPQHAVDPLGDRSSDAESEGAPPYSAPTQAFGATPPEDDKK